MIRSALVKLSARASAIGESATLRVTRRAAELRAKGVAVVDLGAGEPDFASPLVAVEAARQALAEGSPATPRAAACRLCAPRWRTPIASATARPGRPRTR